MADTLRVPELTDREIRQALKDAKTIAVVGLSYDPSRPSYGVA